jgi:CHASE2 domain-containing sensor protein/class 3 adenylate cyclase
MALPTGIISKVLPVNTHKNTSITEKTAFKADRSVVFGVDYSIMKLLVFVTSGFITLLFCIALSDFKYVVEEKFGVMGWVYSSSEELEERITIVAIDEHSLEQVGPWPWSRETLSQLSQKLKVAGADLHLYDIVFPEVREGDDKLLEALQNSPSVLAQIPVLSAGDSISVGELSGAIAGMRCHSALPVTNNYLTNNSNYISIPQGHITPIVDSDGMIRKQPPLICVQDHVLPSLSLQALLQGMRLSAGENQLKVTEGNGFFSPAFYIKPNAYPGIKIPIDEQGNLRVPYYQSARVFQVVSAVDVLRDNVDSSKLEGKWALIGATAFGLGDVVPTPHSGAAPGVEVQARILSGLLDDKIPYQPANASLIWNIECLIIIFILLFVSRRNTRISSVGLPLSAVVLPVIALGIHIQLLSSNIWLGWFAPAMFGFLSASLLALLEHGCVRVERKRVFNNLSSYIPSGVASEIAFNLPSGAIEAQRKELVLLCADLRNFSAYEESRPPEEAAALLHCFFVHTCAIVESFDGQIEELKGDSVLASWSVDEKESATSKALSASHKLQEMIGTVIPPRPPAGLEPIALGISIERGPALVGSIGPAHCRTHTLLGDTVTITLRIQEMTQELAQPILIGECAARDLAGDMLESQGSYLLDGLQTPHILFAPAYPLPSESVEPSSNHLRVISGGRR